jgi:hypothetical protein
MLGDHQDWGKTMPWQGSISVPLFISGPGLARNATVAAPVGTMDVAGTVLDLAGVPPAAGMTTVSLLGFVNGSAAPAYRPFVASGLGEWRAVVQARKDGAFKLICCRSASGACGGAPSRGGAPFVGASGEDEDGRYARVAAGASAAPPPRAAAVKDVAYLYDVNEDVFDMKDLAARKPDAVAAMKALLPPGWCR